MYGDFGEDGPAGLGAEEQRIHGRDTQHRTGGKQGRIIVDFKKMFKKLQTKNSDSLWPMHGRGQWHLCQEPPWAPR